MSLPVMLSSLLSLLYLGICDLFLAKAVVFKLGNGELYGYFEFILKYGIII